MEPSPDKIWLVWLHKSFGILILILAFGRLGWRFLSPRPEPTATLKPWEHQLARLVHFLLYVIFFAFPLSGWVMSSAGGYPVRFFNWFDMPEIVPKDRGLMQAAREVHETLAVVLLVLLALHFAGALKHHALDRDNTLRRMTWSRMSYTGGLVLLGALGVFYLVPIFISAGGEEEEESAKPVVSQQQVEQPVAPAAHSSEAWEVDYSKSTLKITGLQYGSFFEGSFGKFDAEIVFDPEKLEASSVIVTIDTGSFSTGNDDRDQQARSAEWFDTAQFPQAVFTAKSFERTGVNDYMAHGTLKMHGIEQPIDMRFTLYLSRLKDNQDGEMSAEFGLKRSDFGIGSGEWADTKIIGDAVHVSVYVKASRHM